MTELSAPARLAAFGVGLLVVLAASFGVGRVTGDVAQPAVVEQPVVEQPVVEQPVVEQPVVEQPVAEHGEMRS